VHVLIVEDDRRLGNGLVRLLEGDRHLVELTASGEEAIEIAESANGLDAVILDVGLPDISGIEVAQRIRRGGSRLPILMLTARDAIDDRVAGLDAGADDYLVKPFAYEELAARLRALDRRAAHRAQDRPVLHVGAIELDEGLRSVSVDGRTIELSPREFTLLECLLRHPGQVLSRDQLLDAAWPYGEFLTHNTVDTYVHYLRQKLGGAAEQLVTVRGVGYRLVDG
jgi:DNA-binding response OmpR family regulator